MDYAKLTDHHGKMADVRNGSGGSSRPFFAAPLSSSP
jgi:hypothetical protein